jgi:hypothetical protein
LVGLVDHWVAGSVGRSIDGLATWWTGCLAGWRTQW